jgi:hypothetical protein
MGARNAPGEATLSRAPVFHALVFLAALSGCGGDGVILEEPPPPPPSAPTLTSLQEEIFTPRCAVPGCHAAPFPQLGLDLSQGNTHDSLVNVESVELAPLPRVLPGEPDLSYLVLKLEGDPRIVGERMPFGGPYLAASQIQAVRDWIAAGAKDD